MSGNDMNRVANTIGDVTKKVTEAADGAVKRLNDLGNDSLNKIHKVHGVCDQWEKANTALDDFLGQKSNNPPPDGVEDAPGGRDDPSVPK